MALVLETLVAELTEAFDVDVDFDNTAEKQARKIATAIHNYLKSAIVTVSILPGVPVVDLAVPPAPSGVTSLGPNLGVGDPTAGTGGLT